MPRVTISAVAEQELRSPTGKFHSYCRNLSLTLGGIRNAGTWAGGHPFDLQIRRIPVGAAVCPFHSHLGQWELFVIRSGEGTVRVGDERHTVKAGDVFIHPPGEAHQLINTGSIDLETLIVADNPPLDGFYYPDSNKWGLRFPSLFFRTTETDYFDGEDTVSEGGGEHQRADPALRVSSAGSPNHPPTIPVPLLATPFTSRLVHPDRLPWEPFPSPKGKFRGLSKELSIALGAKRNTPTGLGGHPFDLELGRLEPGFAGCPFHRHSSQWEMFIILRGTGTVRVNDETGTVHAGDVVLHPAGEAHQLTNTGSGDLDYFLIADNPPDDWWHYPDSNKWGFRSPRKIFRATDVDYWDGEE